MIDTKTSLWLVENREDFKELYPAALAAHGFPCERRFSSGEELIKALRQTSGPDLLLLDNDLSEMRGASLVKVIKSLSATTLVFVVGFRTNRRDAAEALDGGASGYLDVNDAIEVFAISMRMAISGQPTHRRMAKRVSGKRSDYEDSLVG